MRRLDRLTGEGKGDRKMWEGHTEWLTCGEGVPRGLRREMMQLAKHDAEVRLASSAHMYQRSVDPNVAAAVTYSDVHVLSRPHALTPSRPHILTPSSTTQQTFSKMS